MYDIVQHPVTDQHVDTDTHIHRLGYVSPVERLWKVQLQRAMLQSLWVSLHYTIFYHC